MPIFNPAVLFVIKNINGYDCVCFGDYILEDTSLNNINTVFHTKKELIDWLNSSKTKFICGVNNLEIIISDTYLLDDYVSFFLIFRKYINLDNIATTMNNKIKDVNKKIICLTNKLNLSGVLRIKININSMNNNGVLLFGTSSSSTSTSSSSTSTSTSSTSTENSTSTEDSKQLMPPPPRNTQIKNLKKSVPIHINEYIKEKKLVIIGIEFKKLDDEDDTFTVELMTKFSNDYYDEVDFKYFTTTPNNNEVNYVNYNNMIGTHILNDKPYADKNSNFSLVITRNYL